MATTTARRPDAGFTLIELMISVAIVGILAAVATPMLVKYVKKAKTTEARELLAKISDGARAYFMDPQTAPGSLIPLDSQFPASELATPAATCCLLGGEKCAPNGAQWVTPSWIALAFSVDDPHYFQYEFQSSGTSTTAEYTASAYGDLDCDTTLSTYTISGAILAGSGSPTKSAQIHREKELE